MLFRSFPQTDTPNDYERLIQLFQNTNQAFPFEGNRVDIYTGGYSKLQALLRELQKARLHIHMEYYIFEDDPVGRLGPNIKGFPDESN